MCFTNHTFKPTNNIYVTESEGSNGSERVMRSVKRSVFTADGEKDF